MCESYVYALTDPRNEGRFFYIGKGKGYRAVNHLKPHANRENNSKQATIKAIREVGLEPGVVYLFKGLTDAEACEWEKTLIGFYGRKDLGLGNLTNLTNGGDGTAGRKHSEETKKKMREADRSGYKRSVPVSKEAIDRLLASRVGVPSWSSGKKWTDEQKAKLKGTHSHVPCPTKGMKRKYREDGSFYFVKKEDLN